MSAPYPTLAEVENAGAEQIMRWNRFLPSPRDDDEVEIINAVWKRLGEMPPDRRVTASKTVGWG